MLAVFHYLYLVQKTSTHYWYVMQLILFPNLFFKSKWLGLLHHVCNTHEWLGGKCNHEDQIHDPNLPWFDRRDADFTELQKVILNPELLDSFKYYVRFRYERYAHDSIFMPEIFITDHINEVL